MCIQAKLIVIFSLLLLIGSKSASGFEAENLKCEYLVNPIGIDALNPCLTWKMKSTESGAFQKAYQIFVGTDSIEVAGAKGNKWESGIVVADKMPVEYMGPKPDPFTKYYWGVKIQNEKGFWSKLSAVASFETGIMDQENLKGAWITDTYDYNIKPAPYFRKAFVIKKNIQSARAYIAVAGLYELSVNGKRIGDHRLDPMFTRFDRRNLYLTYDVTRELQEGENVIGVLLGNGWYNHQSKAASWYYDKAPWRARPKFCMDLRVTYTDHSTTIISTGDTWKTSLSPVIFNSIYTGEHYDARLEQSGWNIPGFDDSQLGKVMCTGSPSQQIVAQSLHPVRCTEKIQAKEMVKQDSCTYLFNFGRNISGVSQITVSGVAGTTIRLKHAERVDAAGKADQSNFNENYLNTGKDDPFHTDIFILNGKDQEIFVPRFNYKGFQYVEVSSNKPLNLTKESIVAYFMHSDVPAAGSIHSSDQSINKIWEATNASYLSNLFGYPTDCPTREKNGWTADAHVALETGLYNFDAITIYEKWMADHQDEQQPNGTLPAIIPTSGYGYHWANGPDWTSTIAIVPWNIYLFYGDSRLLERCYENIRRYVDHITGISSLFLTDWGLGDWNPAKSVTPREFTSSTYYFVDATILAKAAKILGKQADYEKYSDLAGKIKDAINHKYLDRQTGIYGNGCQAELSMALYWGLVPDELINKVVDNLKKSVIASDKHLDVGILGSKTILNALSENGDADLAFEVATRQTFPSWGWWMTNGATTLYENWSLNAKNNSMNHVMFGDISAWFYKALGGISPDENLPGFKNIVLKPNFVSGLDQFEAKHEGPYGIIVSSWKRSGGKVWYRVSIPANSTATLMLKAKRILEKGKELAENKQIRVEKRDKKCILAQLNPGEYEFSISE